MNTRTPVKSLIDLKMTHWYLSRKPVIQEAINRYPPGYYIFSANGEVYKLTGWSNPEEKRGELDVYIYLEREIHEGTERLRVHPQYVSPEEDIVQVEEVQDTIPIQDAEYVPAPPIVTGYNVGKSINGEIKYLVDSGERRLFANVSLAKSFLLDNSFASTEEELNSFVYEPVFS